MAQTHPVGGGINEATASQSTQGATPLAYCATAGLGWASHTILSTSRPEGNMDSVIHDPRWCIRSLKWTPSLRLWAGIQVTVLTPVQGKISWGSFANC